MGRHALYKNRSRGGLNMSTAKRIDDSIISDVMSQPNFIPADSSISDPLVTSRIKVTLDQIRAYDKNPRTSSNPKFESIMASIENRGLDHPPNISRRPGETHYMILDGGNTRLEILNVLHQKYIDLARKATSDEERLELEIKAQSFYEFECDFKPWKGESTALAGHMAENEERGETKFIEKALAVQEFRDVYLNEDRLAAEKNGEDTNIKAMSIRKLAERITKQGWTVSHTHITRFDYAATVLLPVIPDVLWSGAGEPVVRQIRKYETAYTEFWKSTSVGQAEPEKLQEYFFEVLGKFDSCDGIDFKSFLQTLNQSLADLVDIEQNIIMAEIDAIIRGVSRDQAKVESSANSKPVTGIEDVIETYQQTGNNSNQIPSSSDIAQSNSSKAKPSDSGEIKPASKPAVSSGKSIENDLSDMDIDSLKAQLINAIDVLQTSYPGLGVTEGSDNFMSLAVVPPYHHLGHTDFSFQFESEDEEATIWWWLFRYTQSFDGIPKEGLHSVVTNCYQHYTHLGNFMDVVLYLEHAFLKLPREIKRILFEIQLIMDELYTQHEIKMMN